MIEFTDRNAERWAERHPIPDAMFIANNLLNLLDKFKITTPTYYEHG